MRFFYVRSLSKHARANTIPKIAAKTFGLVENLYTNMNVGHT